MHRAIFGKGENYAIEKLVQTTHFNRSEVINLFHLYRELTSHKLDRNDFRVFLYEQFDITESIQQDLILRNFNRNNEPISKEEFCKGLSVFLRGTLEERIKFCFDAYCMNKSGLIVRNDVITLLRKAILKLSTEDDPDDFMRDLVDMTIRKLDLDGDSKISFDDFSAAVTHEPELLQCLGILIPTDIQIKAFHDAYFSVVLMGKVRMDG